MRASITTGCLRSRRPGAVMARLAHRVPILAVILTIPGLARVVHGQWTCDDPLTAVRVADDPPGYPVYALQVPYGAVPDSDGGVFIAWTEVAGFPSDRVRIQHLDASGHRLWGDRGMIVLDEPNTGGVIYLISDSADGVILLHHGNDAHLRAHRLDRNGNRLWGPRGVAVLPFDCPNADTGGAPAVADGNGGFFLLWRKYLSVIGQPDELWVNHLSGDGQQLWGGPCGVRAAISDWDLSTHGALLDPDGGGGLFISMTTNNTNVRAQRMDGLGNPLWGTMGVFVSNRPGDQWVQTPIPDGEDGIILIWYQRHPKNMFLDSVWGARLDGNGNNLWTPNGERIFPDSYYLVGGVTDGRGGAWISLWKWGQEMDTYLQRITNMNQKIFPDFLPIGATVDRQYGPLLRIDGQGGLFLVWRDWRAPLSYRDQDLYFQHVLADGRMTEPANGSPVTTAPGKQGEPAGVVAAQNSGGQLFVAWADEAADGFTRNVYAERVPCDAALPGDFDGDGDVDLSDFVTFQLCFGGSNNPPTPTCPAGADADLDGDGDVGLADFLIFQQNFTGSL